MQSTKTSFSSAAFSCSTCLLNSPRLTNSGCYLSRRPIPQAARRIRPSPFQTSFSPVLLSASASSDDNSQADVASTPSVRSSPDSAASTNSWQTRHNTNAPPVGTSSARSTNSSPSAKPPRARTQSSASTASFPVITSVTLNFNGSDPLPSVASLMRYMNDLRPKLDYLDPRARERVLSALEVANVAHKGQLRKSGEPFIIHPIAVAAILADLRMDRDCIIAGLLHDTVEDTPVTLEDLETLFGTDVRRIVEGETKLTKLAKKIRSDQPVELQDSQSSRARQQLSPKCSEPACNNVSEGSKYSPGTVDPSTSDLTTAPETKAAVWQNEREKREEELQKQADNLRAMFIAMTEDVRVIIVKLADRLHNMRTLAHMSSEKQKKISKETLEFFAPLAHRLGMRRIKSELEELSFMYLHPEDYQHLKYEVETMLMRSKFNHYLKSAEEIIKDVLRQDRILYNMIRSVEVTGSTKELYSIYRRIQAGENVSSMLDIATMRVVVDLDPGVDSNQACYHVLGRIHTLWKPLPKRLKDYIAFPKPNGYQSLHTTVLLGQKFDFLTMEIQIRTAEMDRIAEEGIAAELFNAGSVANTGMGNTDDEKEDGVDSEWRRRTKGWLISIREYVKEFSSAKDLVDAVRKDLLGNRVFVFTPKGSIVDLPKDSTPIDVAYRIHSDVGHSMIGAKVNGRLVSLDYKLQNADVVKIISSQYSKGPSSDWISFAKSRTARQKIRSFLRARDRDNMLDRGRRMLEEEAQAAVEPVPNETNLAEILPRLNAVLSTDSSDHGLGSVDDLYVEIAKRRNKKEGTTLERTVLGLLRDRRHTSISEAVSRGVRRRQSHNNSDIENKNSGEQDSFGTFKHSLGIRREVEAILAPCCQPVRGDEVSGVRMQSEENEALVIHRVGCRHLPKEGGRVATVGVKWAVHQREVDDIQQAGDVIQVHRLYRSRRRGNNEGEPEDGKIQQPTRVVVTARDCTGLLAYVTGVIASMGTSIQRCSTVTDRNDMTAMLAFEVLVCDAYHLRRIIERIEECEEVEFARRIGPNESKEYFGTEQFDWDCDEGVCAELLREGHNVEIGELEIEDDVGALKDTETDCG